MQYAMMTTEVVQKMIKCFEGPEDIRQFCDAIYGLGSEFLFIQKLIDYLPEDATPGLQMKCVAMLTLFLRENIECLRELIKVCDVKPVTEEQVKNLSSRVRKKVQEFDEEIGDFDTEL